WRSRSGRAHVRRRPGADGRWWSTAGRRDVRATARRCGSGPGRRPRSDGGPRSAGAAAAEPGPRAALRPDAEPRRRALQARAAADAAGRWPCGCGGVNTRFSAEDGAARLPWGVLCGRARLVSTTTVLDRPWLKLCFTVPALTEPPPMRGFRVRGARPPGAGG